MLQPLRKWFGASGDDEGYIHLFNELVRHELSSVVVYSLGNASLPLKYSIFMVVSTTFPSLAIRIPELFAVGTDDRMAQIAWVLRNFADWAKFPAMVLFYVQTLAWLWSLGGRYKRRYLAAVCMTPLKLMTIAAGWMPIEICLQNTDDLSALPIIPVIALLALDVYLFRDQLPWWSRKCPEPGSAKPVIQAMSEVDKPDSEKSGGIGEGGQSDDADIFEV